MRRLWTRKLRLRSSIVVLFAVLITPIFFTIISLNYISNKNIARENANTLIARFRTEAIDSIQGMFNPIKSLVRSAAMVGSQEPGFYADNRSLKYLLSVLLHSDKVVSIYVGLSDGSFRQARRINPIVKIHGELPPTGVKYAYRWIAPETGSSPLDHYIFLDRQHTQIGTVAQPTTYDPRPRLWYRQTAEDHRLIITDPEVFAAFGLIGFTISAPIYTDGKVTGVAAADITLDGLSQFLA